MSRKTILEKTIKKEIQKESILTEGPISNAAKSVAKAGIFDPIAGAAAGVGNMFSNIRGQFNLGAVNKKLQRSAQRIEDEWNTASDAIADKADKMSNARNPKVKQMGQGVLQNKEQIDQQIDNAVAQMRQISSAGADQAAQGQGGQDEMSRDVAPRQVTDEFGNQYTEYGVDRWMKRLGIDPGGSGKTLKNHLSKVFMDLISNNINPMKVPINKQLPIINYAKNLTAQLQQGLITPEEYEQKLAEVSKQFLQGMSPGQVVNPNAPGGTTGKAKGLTPDEVEKKVGQMSKGKTASKTPPKVPTDEAEKQVLKLVMQQAASQNFSPNEQQKKALEDKVKQAVSVASRVEQDPKKVIPAAIKYLQQFKSPPAPAAPQQPSQATNPAVFKQPPPPAQPPEEKKAVFQQPPELKKGEFMKPPPAEKPKFEPPPSQEDVSKFEKAAGEYKEKYPAPWEKGVFPTPPPPEAPKKPQFVQPPGKPPELALPPEESGPPQNLSDFMAPQLNGGDSPGLPAQDTGKEIVVGSEQQPGFGPKAPAPKGPKSKKTTAKKKTPKSKKKSK